MTTPTAAVNPHELPDVSGLVVGVIGGTGEQGRGLATRLADSGQRVILGSRDGVRAQEAADGIGREVRGMSNVDCASNSDVVIIAVPWDAHASTLTDLVEELRGRIVIDCVNPLGFDKQGAFGLPVAEGSATEQAAALLPESKVTGAFHHLSASLLLDPAVATIDADVMVVGDDREATDITAALANRIVGVRGFYAGRLRNAGQVEALTANLISVNRRFKVHAGIRLTDLP